MYVLHPSGASERESAVTAPIASKKTRLTGLSQACQSAIGSAEYYDHSKTPEWNSSIIVSCHLVPLHGPPAPQGSHF